MPVPTSTATTPATGVRAVWPGLLLAAAGAAVSVLANQLLPTVSAMLVAILLGALLGNLIPGGIPARLSPGLAVASRRLLRLGVVLLGLQLVLGDIAGLGWPVVVGVLVVVSGTYLATLLFGRLLGIADTQTMLVAGGFSICGAAAVAGMEGVLPRRKDEEVATAVALVVVFGTAMIAVMPALTGLFGLDEHTAGLWIGSSVHEVAQVVAAAGIVGPDALKVAVVVKLARVVLLAPMLALVSWRERARGPVGTGTRPPLVPLFVIAFVAMVVIRSLGIVPEPALAVAKLLQAWLLAAAMFALGTSVHWSVLRRTGGRPVLLAVTATVVITLIGAGVAFLAG